MYKSAIVPQEQVVQKAQPQRSAPSQQPQTSSQQSQQQQSSQDIFSRALNISSTRVLQAASPDNPVQTTLRRVELPYPRTVKSRAITQVENKETGQLMEVSGFRVDQVVDSKIVEVTEDQKFNFAWDGRMSPAGPAVIREIKDVGRIPNSRLKCTPGTQVFHSQHPDVRDIELDDDVSSAQPRYEATDSFYKKAPPARGNSYLDPAVLRNPGMQPGGLPINRGSYDRSGFVDPKLIRAAGSGHISKSDAIYGQWTDKKCGLTVKNTNTRHTAGTGVLVTNVQNVSPAARAGIRSHDIITRVNDTRVETVQQFSELVQQSRGNLFVLLNRDGRRNISATVLNA